MKSKILIIGPQKFISRHFDTLLNSKEFTIEYFEMYEPNAILISKPDLVIVPDEHWCELGNIVATCNENGILTIQLMDGILEWRRTWNYMSNGRIIDGALNPINQPAFANKIACIGSKDFRIFESWGNFGKCEIIGIPRFKYIQNLRTDFSHLNKKNNKILICTAKTPGFTKEQLEITQKALLDLKKYFVTRKDIEVIWRVTGNMSKILDIKDDTNDLSGKEIQEIIQNVDAVITTPSTSILEAMVLKTPVAILDYHNLPHYFETAWTISAQNHIQNVVNELLNPPLNKLEYQNFLLNDQLNTQSDATENLETLIIEMLKYKNNTSMIPYSILNNNYKNSYILNSNLSKYYPGLSWLEKIETDTLKLKLAAARGTIEILEKRIKLLEHRLNLIPFYSATKSFIKYLRNKK